MLGAVAVAGVVMLAGVLLERHWLASLLVGATLGLVQYALWSATARRR